MPSPLAERLNAIEDLPTIPHTMQKVLSGLDAVSASADSLEKILNEDTALTGKVLKMANSPLYGGAVEINSLARAIVTLGFEEVRNVVIGLSLSGVFCDDHGFADFNATELWLHSIGVSHAAKLIAQKVDGLDPDEMFTAGMMHDMGRILFCQFFPAELKDILNNCQTTQISLDEAEDRYGLTHSEIGAYLAYRWKLGDFLINVIRYHHHPKSAGPHSKAAACIFLADSLALQLKFGWSGPTAISSKISNPKDLNLSGNEIRVIAQQLNTEKEEILKGWNSVI